MIATTTVGCPFVCKIADTDRVSVSLRNMELVAAGEVAQFEITVDGTSNSELAVALKGERDRYDSVFGPHCANVLLVCRQVRPLVCPSKYRAVLATRSRPSLLLVKSAPTPSASITMDFL